MILMSKGLNQSSLVDVSWPNCNIKQTLNFNIGIVGVNGGLDFRPNPCLAQESSWFRQVSLYLNTGYPGSAYALKFKNSPLKCLKSNSACLAYNYGYNASLYALNYASEQGVHTNLWWLDVESDNSWTTNHTLNRLSLEGAIMAIKNKNFWPVTIGFYAAPNQWNSLIGQWHNKLPSWVGIGSTTQKESGIACLIPSFTGGINWLSQYTSILDKNVFCNKHFEKTLLNI